MLQYAFDNDAGDGSSRGYASTVAGVAHVQRGALVLDAIRDAVAVPRIGGDSAIHLNGRLEDSPVLPAVHLTRTDSRAYQARALRGSGESPAKVEYPDSSPAVPA